MTGPDDPARTAGESDVGERRSARMVALAVLALVLFGWPFLVIFDQPVRVFGLPLLWAWLFSAWVLVIGLIAAVVRDR